MATSRTDAFTTHELIELSREISHRWEVIAVLLGFSRCQIQAVNGMSSLSFWLIYSWYDVVKHCDNCRHLLAKTFVGIRDNLTASMI